MKRRTLGRTGVEVGCVGLGGMGFISKAHPEEKSGFAIILEALDRGMTFIDTARGYFDSEERIGRALGERRKEVFLATKTFLRSRKAAYKEIETSLRNLRTDWIDLYQVHHVQYRKEFDQVTSPDGAMEALVAARKEGKIRFIGITSHRPELMVECVKTGLFDTVQIPVNPVEKESIEEIVKTAREMNLGIIAMKPLAGGNLTNVELALKFTLSHPVSVVIPGCSTLEHVRTDAAVGEFFDPIREEEVETLRKAVENKEEKFCRRCRYCEPVCPQGIPIYEIFRAEDYLILSATYARDQYQAIANKADICDQCGACEEICPYMLPIRERLKRAHKRLMRGRIEDMAVHFLRKLNLYDKARKIYFEWGGRLPER